VQLKEFIREGEFEGELFSGSDLVFIKRNGYCRYLNLETAERIENIAAVSIDLLKKNIAKSTTSKCRNRNVNLGSA
jgi:hypothetical protein